MTKKDLMINWIKTHNFPILIKEHKILWLTKIQCAEYDIDKDMIFWHNKEYFYE